MSTMLVNYFHFLKYFKYHKKYYDKMIDIYLLIRYLTLTTTQKKLSL